jgi:DNA-binding GntR family transcriptional regulator
VHPGALRSEQAYAELKQRLLAGDFRLGARLKETKLAALLDVSRTPVREALLRLHAEGLVTRQPDGGYIPVVPDVPLIRSLYEVRAGLELQAIRRGGHDRDTVAALLDEWHALADDEPEAAPAFVLLDESFHQGLAEAAGNSVLADVLRQINERIRPVRMVDFLTPDRITSTIAEHLEPCTPARSATPSASSSPTSTSPRPWSSTASRPPSRAWPPPPTWRTSSDAHRRGSPGLGRRAAAPRGACPHEALR